MRRKRKRSISRISQLFPFLQANPANKNGQSTPATTKGSSTPATTKGSSTPATTKGSSTPAIMYHSHMAGVSKKPKIPLCTQTAVKEREGMRSRRGMLYIPVTAICCRLKADTCTSNCSWLDSERWYGACWKANLQQSRCHNGFRTKTLEDLC